VTSFNPLNEYGAVEIALHTFLVWTLDLKELPPRTVLAGLKRLGREDDL